MKIHINIVYIYFFYIIVPQPTIQLRIWVLRHEIREGANHFARPNNYPPDGMSFS